MCLVLGRVLLSRLKLFWFGWFWWLNLILVLIRVLVLMC